MQPESQRLSQRPEVLPRASQRLLTLVVGAGVGISGTGGGTRQTEAGTSAAEAAATRVRPVSTTFGRAAAALNPGAATWLKLFFPP